MLDDKEPSPATAEFPAVFLPLKGRIVGLFLGGSFLGLIGGAFTVLAGLIVWARLIASDGQSADAFIVALVLLALGTFLGLIGSWLLLLGIRCRQMRMEARADGLDLTTSRYEWFLWNPRGIQKTVLRWDEIKGLRLWEIPNRLAPGGVQRNYILYTAQGTLVLSSAVWPHPEQMVAVIAKNTALRTAQSLEELPAELAEIAQPSRKERLGVRFVHGLGLAAIIFGWLAVAIVVLVMATGQSWKGSPALMVPTSLALVLGGHALRRFRLE